MARQRMLHPTFFTDARVCAVSPLARLLFLGLLGLADREGRLEDAPLDFKIRLLPVDACDVEALLGELSTQSFIQRYTIGGRRLIEIRNFTKHQNPHRREPSQCFPGPDGAASTPVPGRDFDALRRLEKSSHDEKPGLLPHGGAPSPGQPGLLPVPRGGSPAESESESVYGVGVGVRSLSPQPPKGGGVSAASPFKQPPSAAVAAHAEGPPLGERMDAVFREVKGARYARQPGDDIAMGKLLALARQVDPANVDAVILRHWRHALTARYRRATADWTELAKRFNEHAAAEDSTPTAKPTADRPRLS